MKNTKSPAKKAAPVKTKFKPFKLPKVAAKTAQKKPAAKKPALKKAPVAKVTVKKLVKAVTPKIKNSNTFKTLKQDRVTKHGVEQPKPGSIAAALWEIADRLKTKLGRPPARFEYRQAVAEENAKRKKLTLLELVDASASFQFFKWRTFNGVKGRSAGIYPKRNSFDLSTPTRKPAKAPKTAPVAPVKTKPAAKPAKVKTAKKAAKAKAPEAAPIGVSSRLAEASANAGIATA